MNKEKKLPLDDIHIYFCTLPDLQPVDNTSDFSPLKYSIIKYFELKDHVLNQIDNSDKQVILITFTRMKSLYDCKTYVQLTEHPIRSITHCSEPQKDFSHYRPYPMVLIGLEDISKVLETQKVYNPENCPKNLCLDPRVKFFDANIWHRYVPLGEGFFEKFQDVLVDIIGNYRNELYQTIVACEYMEFQTRMLRNSFLALIGSEGHGRSVTPFKYHSETLMKEKAKDELVKIKKYASDVKWHFILADDYGDVPLRAKQDRNINQTKKQIIESLINSEKQFVEITNAVESAQSKKDIENLGAIRGSEDVIQATEEKIKEKMYDMILLDYLLGENTEEDCREYGHELLEKIFHAQPGEQIFKNKGPMNYFWIFPISVFSYAILDELYEKGISHFSEHWHLASGADPVNTPQLFRYKLFRFMNMQLREAGVIDEFKAINQNPPKEDENIRNWASDIFGKLLLEFGNKKKLIQDAQSGNSEFAKSVISSHDEIHYYEHLQHLVYLLAYGAGLEWPEMWHELEYLKSSKKLMDKLSKSCPSFFPVIEKYILALQGQYS